MSAKHEFTSLLLAWQQGDEQALQKLSPFVYQELRRLAGRAMAGEGAGHTLQTTALVHEAYVRLVDAEVDFQGRHHFFALAARMMRRILVDHARAKRRVKRGGNESPVDLEVAAHIAAGSGGTDILELDEALTKLAENDPRLAEAVELIYFGGLSYDEAAAELGISRSVLGEDLKFAKAWLKNAMS